MFSFPEGFCEDCEKKRLLCKNIFLLFLQKCMLVGYVCKNVIITKFLILYVYKHKTSRSRIPRRIILYNISTWLINVLLQIARVVMRLVRKSHLSFFQKTKNFARNEFISLIARTGHRQNILLYVLTTSMINL